MRGNRRVIMMLLVASGTWMSSHADPWFVSLPGSGLNTPAWPVSPAAISQVVSGGGHYVVLLTNSTVVAWGDNWAGQINVPDGLSNVLSVAAGSYHSLALTANGKVAAFGGDSYSGQTNIPADLSNVVSIAAGSYHSLALRQDGCVVAWGANRGGQTNVPVNLSNVVSIAAGGYHSLALRQDGCVVAWGENGNGQTNVPVNLSNVVSIAAGGFHSLALLADGRVQCWGDKWSQYGLTNVPAQVSNAVEVACGFVDAFARLANGRTVAWGGSFTFSQNYNSPKNQPARELFGIEHMNGGPYFVIGKMNVSPVRGKPPRGTYVDAKWMNSGSIDLRGWNVDTNAYITVQQAQDLGEKSWGDAFTYGYGYGYGAIIRYGYGYGYDGYIERPFLEWSTAMTNRIGFVRIIHTY